MIRQGKKFRIFLVLLFCSLIGFAGSSMQSGAIAKGTEKKYGLSVCAVFKNESAYLREWIEYHRLIGIEHFYLYSNNSSDRFKEVLDPFIKRKIVTLINWPDALKFSPNDRERPAFIWTLATQVPAYENAAKIAAINETKWLVFLDVNEFLVPPQSSNLQEILQKYEAFPGVELRSVFFDSSKLDVPRRKLVIEALELTDIPEQHPQKGVVKMIFKPEMIKGFTWPPYKCHFKDNQVPVVLNKSELRINHYVNRGSIFRKNKEIMHVDNRQLTEDELASLLSAGFEIEDQERSIYRFVPSLLKKMGYETGWDWGRK